MQTMLSNEKERRNQSIESAEDSSFDDEMSNDSSHNLLQCQDSGVSSDNQPISAQKVLRSSKVFTCTRCSYSTDRKNNLKRHVSTMHDPVSAALDCCGARFATKGDLREHTRAAHGAGYTCWQCGHTFCRRALLHRHQSVHSGLKAFSCSKCGYQSSHKSNMQRHMHVHQQARNASKGILGRAKEKWKPNLKCTSVLKIQGQPSLHYPNQANTKKSLLSSQCFSTDNQNNNNPRSIASDQNDSMINYSSPLFTNLSENTFSRALTSLKSIHFSKHESNKESIRKMPDSSNKINLIHFNDKGNNYESHKKITNSEIWRLAFSNQYKPELVYQPNKNNNLIEIVSNERTRMIQEIHPFPINNKVSVSEMTDYSRLVSNKSKSDNNLEQPSSSRSTYSSPTLTSSLSSVGNVSPSSDIFLKRPPLLRPIPRYRRLPTDFSVKTLLGSRSPPRAAFAGRSCAFSKKGLLL